MGSHSCYNCIYCLIVIGEDSVKELQRKRHSATPGVSMKGRVRKIAKWKPESEDDDDDESYEQSECEHIKTWTIFWISWLSYIKHDIV